MNRRHLQLRRWSQRMLSKRGQKRRDRRYPRRAVKHYNDSPFKFLFESKDDQALLNATGVDHLEFGRLLSKFAPLFNMYKIDERDGLIKPRISKKGRKRSLDAIGCLGLVLMWFRTKGAMSRTLPLVFGLTFTPMVRWLCFGKRCLFVALSDFKPKLPDEFQCNRYKGAIAAKYREQAGVAFAVDGLKLPIQKSTNDMVQRRFYNGWTHGHYVSSIFLFAPDGTIPACSINAPGCWHDSTVADYGGVYEKMERLYKDFGAKTVVDSAFKIGDGEFLVRSRQDGGIHIAGEEHFRKARAATAIRQLSEWGMHQIQSKFPRMTDTLLWEEVGKRRIDITLMVRLYNHQVQTVGMNQILSTFMSESSAERSYFGHANLSIDEDANDIVSALAHSC